MHKAARRNGKSFSAALLFYTGCDIIKTVSGGEIGKSGRIFQKNRKGPSPACIGMARSFTRRRRFRTRKIRFNAVFPQCPEVCKAFQSASRLKKTSACDGETFKGGRKDAPLKRRGNGMRRLPARSRQYFFRRADLKIFKFTAAAASRQAKES